MRKLDILKHLFSFPTAFAGFVGAPSILNLIEILIERRFLDLFAWITEGYEQILELFGFVANIFVEPFVAALNGIFGTNLVPGEQWRPLFILMMIFVAPHVWPVGKKSFRTYWLLFLTTVYFLYAAVITSFVPTSPWPWQMLIAALPFAFFWIALLEDSYLAMRRRGQAGAGRHAVQGLWIGLGFCMFLSFTAALFCLHQSTRMIAGMCALLAFIVLFNFGGMLGAVFTHSNRVYSSEVERQRELTKNEGVLRDGCRTLSGLILAIIIVLLDRFLSETI